MPLLLRILVTAAASACLDPTQVTLTVRTNAPCADAGRWRASRSTSDSPAWTWRAALPRYRPTRATPPSAASYAGCIVARRTVSFIAHSSNSVIVDLTTDCTGRGCDLNHTCVNGSCTDTLTATPPVSADGGVPSTGPVRCGDNGVVCPTNDPTNACCLAFNKAAGTTTGDCRKIEDCPPTNVALQCGSAADCVAAGVTSDAGPVTCCLNLDSVPTGAPYRAYSSYCASTQLCPLDGAGAQFALCEDRSACPVMGSSSACRPSQVLPGYYYCGAAGH